MYKYLSNENGLFFENGMVRFTQPGFFNDPFELKPYFSEFIGEEAKKSIVNNIDEFVESTRSKRKWYTKIVPVKLESLFWKMFIESKDPKVVAQWDKFNKMGVDFSNEKFREVVDRSYGILCLSDTPDNLLMWAHYANCHQGYVLEFDTDHEFFNQSVPNEKSGGILEYSGSPMPVRYTSERPSGPFFEKSMMELFLTKSIEWEYEREHRMIMPLESASICVDEKICLFKVPFCAVKAVRFGTRAQPTFIESCKEKVELWTEKHKDLSIIKYELSEKKFELVETEI